MAGEDEGKKTKNQAGQGEDSTEEGTAQEKVQQESAKAKPSKKQQDEQERKWR